MRQAIPRFFLYGEAPARADERFVHVEPLERRSRPNNWTIRPHSHPDLNHLILIMAGQGSMLAGGVAYPFTAPCLLLVPSGEVHGFAWDAAIRGYILTFVESLLQGLIRREPGLQTLYRAACHIPLDTDMLRWLDGPALAQAMEQELASHAPGHALVVEAHLTTLLIGALRAAHLSAAGSPAARGPRAALVARFRELLEVHLRDGWGVADYAAGLKVTPARLRAACIAVTGRSSIEVLQERLLTEAKRLLTYTDFTVSEVAYDLGFEDAAYFSRFFAQRAGVAPARFRQVGASPLPPPSPAIAGEGAFSALAAD